MKSVKDLWNIFEEQLRKEEPVELRKLNGPVTTAELKKLDAILPHGARLPNDYLDLIRIHNGSNHDNAFDFEGYDFLSMDGILQAYGYMKDRADKFTAQYGEGGPKPVAVHGVQQVFNNPFWIPVLAASDWKNFICLDYDPASGGTKCQVIDVHFRAGPVGKVFRNFTEFFNELMWYHIEDSSVNEETKPAQAEVKAAPVKEESKKPQKTSIWSRIFARESLSQESIDISTQSNKSAYKPTYLKW